jgi:5'-3' exonuclease
MKRICLIDLSSIFRMHWHATEHEEISEAYKKTCNDIFAVITSYDHVGICIDSPPYLRQELDPQYKAHREKAPAVMHEQLAAVIQHFRDEGWHVFGAEGYEADDIICKLVECLTMHKSEITIYSSDKDLLQLVGDKVSAISVMTKQKFTPTEIVEKFGVLPHQIHDMLALTGDKSDNVPGVKGVGPKTAAKWINEYGSLSDIIKNADKLGRFAEVVKESGEQLEKSWQLTKLLTDAPIDPGKIFEPVVRKEQPKQEEIDLEPEQPEPEVIEQPKTSDAQIIEQPKPTTAVVKVGNVAWDKSLEPRDSKQAWHVASMLYKSRLFGDFPNPEAIMAVIMTGRTFGMDAVASLRGFHIIKGKSSPSSQLLIGLVKKSSHCEYFRLAESTKEQATWETKRRGEPEPTRMTYSMDDARSANIASLDQWKKRPQTMLRWRAGVELARVVYPDIVSGLYTVDEVQEF